MALSIAPFPSRGGPMGRKVTFTPRRFLRKIWQLGLFDVSRDGRRLAYAANKGRQWSVYVMDLRTKRTKTLLRSVQSVVQPEFSPDGKWLAVQSDFEGDENYNIYATPAAGGKARKVTDTPWDSASPRWSPDGRRIAFLSNRDGDRDNVFVMDASGGDAKQLTNVDDIVTEIAWSPDGKRIAYLENHDGNIQLMTVSRDGSGVRTVSPARGSASYAAWHPDGSGLLYYHSTFMQPHRLLLRRGGRTTTLVDSLQVKLPTSELVDGELIRYRSFDGRQIPAWLFEPRKGRSRHAAVVDPHGGPESQTVNEWRPRFQFMVAEGFTILAPNYRGGTGYGRAWRRLSDRDLGGGDMQDIMAGGRWLREDRRFPRERLGVVGISYGGYAAAHVLEQAPELWAVGVSIVGYFNWLTATTNERGYLRRYDRQKMGHPDTDTDLYRKFSPIYYLDRIRAPVLFTGGAHDPRCPVTEARGMVDEMKKMGKVVDYLEFPDEGHWPRKMANQITLNERVLDWLKRYLPDA